MTTATHICEPRNWFCPRCRQWLAHVDMNLQHVHEKCQTKAEWREYPICLRVPCPHLPEEVQA